MPRRAGRRPGEATGRSTFGGGGVRGSFLSVRQPPRTKSVQGSAEAEM